MNHCSYSAKYMLLFISIFLCMACDSASQTATTTATVNVAGGAVNVNPSQTFTVNFSQPVTTSSVNEETYFLVHTPDANASELLLTRDITSFEENCDANNAIAATVSCDFDNLCSLEPDEELELSNEYTLCLTSEILFEDTEEYGHLSATSFRFTTASDSTFSVGGSLSGLSGIIVLQNNESDDLTLGSNRDFVFTTQLNDGASYDVSILSKISNLDCTITNGSGTIDGADVDDIEIACGDDNSDDTPDDSGSEPSLVSLSPSSGTAAGGTSVTLTGTDLTGTTGVTFGGSAATSVVVVNSTTVTAVAPAHAAGVVDVVLTTPNGSDTLSSGYTYTAVVPSAPTLSSLDTSSGTSLGGTTVTLTGTNLTGTTGVTFDGSSATNVTVTNSTTVSADTPAHAAGAVDVVITTAGGSATLTNAFTYVVLPTIASINPSSGTAAGNTGFTVTGTNLTGATAVTFGGIAATSVNVVNSTTVTGVSPAHAAGAVDVVITTASGSATLTNGYTFIATSIGQASGGGTIACLGGGSNNIISTESDNSTGIEWGGSGTTTTAQSNTDGSANTTTIVSSLGANGGTPYAAELCDNFEVDSQGNTPCQAGNTCYSDWFLPAKDQLNCLYTNKDVIGGFSASFYFGSTEFSGLPSTLAGAQSFSTGAQSNANKLNTYRVRCTRNFTP